MIAELKTQTVQMMSGKEKIHAIILLVENSEFDFFDKPYYQQICGKSMHAYLEKICEGLKKSLIVLNENEDVYDAIKAYLDNGDLTLILFSDTPFITREIIEEYFQKFLISGDNVMILPRGFIFKTNYLKTCKKINVNEFNAFNKDEFFQVKNLQDFETACRVMQNKIINYYMLNGVKVVDKTTIKIDADVNVEPGCEILPFTQILGKSHIFKGSKISSSILKNCLIEECCEITNCNLTNCKVFKNTTLKPFTFAISKQLGGGEEC